MTEPSTATNAPPQSASRPAVDARAYSRYERIYLVLAATFVTTLVLTNIIGIKLFRAPFNPEFALTTGIITYPITFLITDIVSEIWGKKRANFMVFLGFFMSLLMLAIVQIAVHVSPHPYWAPGEGGFFADLASAGPGATLDTGETAHELVRVTGGNPVATRETVAPVMAYQHAFDSVFALNGLLLFGSMLAYLVAQLIDVRLYHFWKKLTKGRHLWLRNNGSTWVSQLVDTAIVNSILFYLGFKMDFMVGVQIMVTIYLYKLVIAAIDTPLIYLGVYITKRLLGVQWADEVDPDRLGEPA
ncbi:MAG TPA: hypothetical protein DIU15_13085 [Deltaproteobacteria bacterium]|nr:hypothetical protein [Deltaproteobacteria bacterium]HCP46974.1 hypothetical protein [Deltaproteobacteria bacterium]